MMFDVGLILAGLNLHLFIASNPYRPLSRALKLCNQSERTGADQSGINFIIL